MAVKSHNFIEAGSANRDALVDVTANALILKYTPEWQPPAEVTTAEVAEGGRVRKAAGALCTHTHAARTHARAHARTHARTHARRGGRRQGKLPDQGGGQGAAAREESGAQKVAGGRHVRREERVRRFPAPTRTYGGVAINGCRLQDGVFGARCADAAP